MVSKKLIFKFLIDIILPNRCPMCDKLLRWDGLLCEKCKAELENLELEDSEFFEGTKAWSLYRYEGKCVDMIYTLKHGGVLNNFAEYSAVKLAERIRNCGFAGKIDIVTAVPMYRRKKAKRGINHAELLAGYVGEALHKPTDFRLIKHLNDDEEQHHMSAEERKVHAKIIYSANKKHPDVSGKTILICDDVITTGSTINVCAGILREMGAEVCCCSVCYSVKNTNKFVKDGENNS